MGRSWFLLDGLQFRGVGGFCNNNRFQHTNRIVFTNVGYKELTK